MSLGHRISRLERTIGPQLACRVCRDEGPAPQVLLWDLALGGPEPAHPVCPACGRGPKGAFKLIILDDGPAPWAKEAGRVA